MLGGQGAMPSDPKKIATDAPFLGLVYLPSIPQERLLYVKSKKLPLQKRKNM
jgi:hypothetical protein